MADKYKGSCYIGVVGSETENGECRDSIESIERGPKDELHYVRATKGYEARQSHINNWYEATKHPFLLLLDHDMKFPAYTLKRLRAHGLPYVSGLYMRRRYAPIAPVWFEYGEVGQMPMIPFTAVPISNALHKIGASGWGCILMHRDVITATRPLLKGEPEVIEDDMDVFPYDLGRIMAVVAGLEAGTLKPESAAAALREEIRPLRGMKDTVGSDIRFPFYARLAGFDLWGDSGVQCDHMLNYPLAASDYAGQAAHIVRDITINILQQTNEERQKIAKGLEGMK